MNEQEMLQHLITRIRDGKGWHGRDIADLTADVTAEEAGMVLGPGTHSVWQIVLHLIAWRDVACRLLAGESVDGLPEARNWPAVIDTSIHAWLHAREELAASQQRFAEAMMLCPASNLSKPVPGQTYTFEDLLFGVLHHDIYHAGQVAIARNAVRARSKA